MTLPSIEWHSAPDTLALAHDLAGFVADRLRHGLARRGQALLIVSGGSTPVPFFEALGTHDLDWPRVTITLADERWVPPDHQDSNERLVRAHLLQAGAAQACFVPLKTAATTVEQGLVDVAAALSALPWPADAVVLGMGGDGHTASLFPNAPELARALSGDAGPVLSVPAPALPNVPVPRISLTARALLDTTQVVVHATGKAKAALLSQARLAGPVQDLPVRLAWSRVGVPCSVFYAD